MIIKKKRVDALEKRRFDVEKSTVKSHMYTNNDHLIDDLEAKGKLIQENQLSIIES